MSRGFQQTRTALFYVLRLAGAELLLLLLHSSSERRPERELSSSPGPLSLTASLTKSEVARDGGVPKFPLFPPPSVAAAACVHIKRGETIKRRL